MLKIIFNSHIGDKSALIRVDLVLSSKPFEIQHCTSHRTTNYLLNYLQKNPSLRASVLFIKYFLSDKNLNNTYLGGLNAYGLSLLMIAYKEAKKI